MALWIHQKKWYFVGSFFAFLVIFWATIHFSKAAGEESPSSVKFYFLLLCWWAALLSLYSSWVAETLHGKSKDKSNFIKALKLAFPTFFVLFAGFTASGFIGNV